MVGLITCLRRPGDCLLLPGASTIQLAAVCPSPHFLLPLLWLSSHCRHPCLNVQQHKRSAGHTLHPTTSFKAGTFHSLHPFVAILLSLFPFNPSLFCCFSLILLMYIPTSLFFFPLLLFSLFFFPCVVWLPS